jgi:hypothetical protein
MLIVILVLAVVAIRYRMASRRVASPAYARTKPTRWVDERFKGR